MVGPRETGSTGAAPTASVALTRDQVLTAALHILDAEGLEALSMRHLAHSLNREAMTLYRYARNKTALLDGVVELVLRQLRVDPAAADWREELRELARNFRRLCLAHPSVVPLLATRPEATPLGLRPSSTMRLVEDFLELLSRAGFTPPNALHAYRLFFGFLHGQALAERQERADKPDETEDLLRLTLRRLPPSEFPELRGLTAEFAGYDGAAQLDQGVEMMITGLESHFKPGAQPDRK
jgi:AcrR family transcriptional regulator